MDLRVRRQASWTAARRTLSVPAVLPSEGGDKTPSALGARLAALCCPLLHDVLAAPCWPAPRLRPAPCPVARTKHHRPARAWLASSVWFSIVTMTGKGDLTNAWSTTALMQSCVQGARTTCHMT